MDAAVSLHHHGALPAAAASLPPHHHHRALHLRHPPQPSVSARLAVTAAPSRAPRRSSSSSSISAAPAHPARASTTTSSRAATGYAAALADASLRAGTLPGAARHARALLRRLKEPPRGRGQRLEDPDARVGALVRLLVGKGKAGMVADVMAEFAALCDHLVAPPSSSGWSSKRAQYAPAY